VERGEKKGRHVTNVTKVKARESVITRCLPEKGIQLPLLTTAYLCLDYKAPRLKKVDDDTGAATRREGKRECREGGGAGSGRSKKRARL